MAAPRAPQVVDASDPKQVKRAGKKEIAKRDQELHDLRAVLELPNGRRVLWRLLTYCRAFESVLHASGSMVYYNAGQQDVGHYLMAEIGAADDEALFVMMREAKAAAEREQRETDAAHTQSATEEK